MNKHIKPVNYFMKLICTLILIILLASCRTVVQNPQANEPAPATPPPTAEPLPVEEDLTDFFPLKSGNMWEFEGEGMEYASFVQTVVNQSGNRYQLTIDNGATIIANVIEVNKDIVVNTYREGEAYDNVNILNKPSNLNIILLMTPLEKGTFWISEENRYEIIDTEADITVPAGSFENCIVVKENYKDQTDYMLFYYKRGMGLVQSQFVSDGGDMITSKLKRYSFQ